MPALVLAKFGPVFLFAAVLASQTVPEPAYEDAARWFQQGRAGDAEAALNSLLKSRPGDVRALMLLGVVLDSGQRYKEAETFYKRALEVAPRSAPLLNNLGNHYLAAGNPSVAEDFYRRVVALDARHANANLHLAEMRVAGKHGSEALAHLDRLSPSEQAEPVAQLLRGQALTLSNRCDEAAALLGQLQERTGSDSSFSFSIGLAYAACKHYEPAESSFARALQADPTNFDVLYNLGLVARHAGHLDRAQQVFEIALQQRPEEPDVLYGLAEVLAETGNKLMATALLYRLQRLAPARADAVLLLAHTAEDLGYYEEAATTYRRYLKLRPSDDEARRECGFALARAGTINDALVELRRFVRYHPKSALGQYQLAIAEAFTEPQTALLHLDRALTLDPALSQARYARAVLHYQQGQPDLAVADFQFLLEENPENPRVLDWLGEVYLQLDRAPEAVGFLKRAVERAPRDRAALMHYSMALRQLGRTEELAVVLATLKHVASSRDRSAPHKGLFNFLELSPEQQRSQYLQSLEAAVAVDPRDATLKARLAKALLEQGRTAEASVVFREIVAPGTDKEILADCGRTLLQHEQYALAAEILKSLPGARLDLAIAVFHSLSPEAGLSELAKIPEEERRGDYYLLRAEMLDSLGRLDEAGDSLNRGIRAAPTRADMYFQAAVFLIKHERHAEAVELLADATRVLPDASELLLTRAIALELIERTEEALKVLAQIESRWPEWDRPYLINGIILENEHKSAEAIQMLDMAIALGAQDPDTYYYQALALSHATPEKLDDARKAIFQALALNAEDPSIQLLAGTILLHREDYALAVEHLIAAVRLQPASLQAHNLLRAAYSELGDTGKAAAEVEQIKRIARENPHPDQIPSPMQRLLFAVRSGGW